MNQLPPNWRDKLHPASFRGISFLVDADDIQAGRRLQIHEFPKRDKAFAEDMGRSTREINLTAWVAGDDFMASRNQLLEALEQAGPGTLVHPWYGQLNVVVGVCRVTHQWEEGRLVRFQLQFYEAHELTAPTVTARQGYELEQRVNHLTQRHVDDFTEVFDVQNWPDFVRESALNDVVQAVQHIEQIVGQYGNAAITPFADIRRSLSTLIDTPAALGQRVKSAFQSFRKTMQLNFQQKAKSSGLQQPILANEKTSQAPLNMLRSAEQHFPVPNQSKSNTPAQSITQARQQQINNQQAIATFIRRMLITESAGAINNTTLLVQDGNVPLRQILFAAIDQELAFTPDATFEAMRELRALAHHALVIADMPTIKIKTITPKEILPAVVLAYEYQGNARQEEALIQRNTVQHPGFIPIKPLRVIHA